MKKVFLKRTEQTDEYTLGRLYVDNKSFCSTLELPWKDNQKGISCIPAGKYKLSPYPSKKFGEVYVVTPVENRTGILIHTGNTTDDIEGCILVGDTVSTLNDKMAVLNSKRIFAELKKLLGNEEYEFYVSDAYEHERVDK